MIQEPPRRTRRYESFDPFIGWIVFFSWSDVPCLKSLFTVEFDLSISIDAAMKCQRGKGTDQENNVTHVTLLDNGIFVNNFRSCFCAVSIRPVFVGCVGGSVGSAPVSNLFPKASLGMGIALSSLQETKISNEKRYYHSGTILTVSLGKLDTKDGKLLGFDKFQVVSKNLQKGVLKLSNNGPSIFQIESGFWRAELSKKCAVPLFENVKI